MFLQASLDSVIFFKKEDIDKALKKDRELLFGRPMFVSRWSNKRRGEKAPAMLVFQKKIPKKKKKNLKKKI